MDTLIFILICIAYTPPPYSQLGSTAVGIRTSEGVILAVEKRITSSLMEPSSIEKILEIDSHIGKPDNWSTQVGICRFMQGS